MRQFIAVVTTAVAALVAAGAWVLGQARYLDGYCTGRGADSLGIEPTGGRPAYWDGPWTVACEYDGMPTATFTEPLPFLGALVLAALVVAVGVSSWRWARRAA